MLHKQASHPVQAGLSDSSVSLDFAVLASRRQVWFLTYGMPVEMRQLGKLVPSFFTRRSFGLNSSGLAEVDQHKEAV